MTSARHVLLVEDIHMQYISIKHELEAAGWRVSRAEDAESAIRSLTFLENEATPVDVLAIDLGLPPRIDDLMSGGLVLIERIRQQNTRLPILAYTSIPPRDDYAFIAARLLAYRASFVYLRPLKGDVTLASLLQLTRQEFVLFSPAPADYLPRAIATRPDPLGELQWQTLRFLSENLTYRQIAEATAAAGPDTVKARINTIRDALVQAGELEVHRTEAEDLRQWYKAHHVRYHRP